MKIEWTQKSIEDTSRLYNFLQEKDVLVGERTIQLIVNATKKLEAFPKLGEKLDMFISRDIRKFFVENYEIRYEIQGNTIFILRVWHTRETR